MKKIMRILPVILATIAVFAASTLSWLAVGVSVPFPTDFGGSTKTAYFAAGDGSKGDPYVISSPVHFYNLAWLQYLGYFNLGTYINNDRAQSYFKLDFDGANLDMQGLAIPPIGTREYPFIGFLDGNGKTVSDFVVSNSINDLVRRPLAAVFENGVLKTTGNRTNEQVDILGLFGVTGDFNTFISTDYNTKSVKIDGNPVNVTVHKMSEDGKTLVPLPDVGASVAKNEVYYSAMNVHSFYADKIRINSVSSNALIGLAAGYVSSTVENVGVYRSKVSVSGDTAGGVTGVTKSSGEVVTYNDVISNYSIVGDYDNGIVGWSEVPGGAQGGGTQGGDSWGGSIDMKMINRRVNYMFTEGSISNRTSTSAGVNDYNIKVRLSQNFEYYWKQPGGQQIIAYLEDGTILPLNVDMKSMYLDADSGGNYEKESTKTFNGKAMHTNAYYENNTSEIVDATSNTGYIIGSKDVRLRIQGLNGINQSFGLSGTATAPATFVGDNFTMLTTNEDGTVTYKIQSPASASNTMFNGYAEKPTSDFKYYDSVRKNFIESMSGESFIHGFHFVKNVSISGGTIPDNLKTTVNNAIINGEQHDSYQFIAGGLNFSVKSDNMLRLIAGTYFAGGGAKHWLFDLFGVQRDAGGNITGVEQIKQIYYNNTDGVSYNAGNAEDLVIDLDALNTNLGLSSAKSAYYFEIPVKKGDYMIGGLSTRTNSNTAYLMYLDIGANGSEGSGSSGGETETLPYIMKSVDFVSAPQGGGDVLSVPDNGATFPKYADIGLKLSSAAGVVYYKREDYTALPENEEDEITTPVYFLHSGEIQVAVFPTDYGGTNDDERAKWEN